jgi:hypothetical protein
VRILLLAVNLVLILSFAALVLSVLRVRGVVASLAGLFVLAYADVVLILEAAGLVAAVRPAVVLSLQAVLTAAAAFAWLRAGRPSLPTIIPALRPGDWLRGWRSRGRAILLIVVAAVVAFVYLRDVLAILAVAPNTYDSLTYHLSRVGYWLQYGSFFPWPTPNPRQTSFPMNAELGFLWTVLWWRTDQLTAFVQWMAVPSIMLSIYGLARILGYSKWSGMVTALLWATLTQVIFQAATTQNDLATAGFWIASVFFFIRGLRERRGADAVLSGLAFGLAMGTKGTSFMFLPGFGVGVLLVALPHWRDRVRQLRFARWIAACVLGLLVCGSYAYVQNSIAYGKPLGPATANTGAHLVQVVGGLPVYASRLSGNLGRYAYQAVDFSPLGDSWAEAINPAKAAAFSSVFRWLRIPVENPVTIATPGFDLEYINPLNEDRSWFGPLALFLMIAILVQAYEGLRRRDGLRLGLLIMGLGFVVVESALEQWTPYKGRYFAIAVAVLFPLVACLVQTRRAGQVVLTLCVVALGLTTAIETTLDMPVLQGVGWRDALRIPRAHIRGPKEFEYLTLMNNLPADASVGLTGGGNFADYPFFGDGFTHYVTLDPRIPWIRPLRINMEPYIADFERSDYLFLSSAAYPSGLTSAPAGFDLMSADGTYSVWMRRALRPPDKCEGDQWPFREFFQLPEDAAVCPRFPFMPPRTLDSGTAPLYLEDNGYIPTITAGDHGSMVFDLLAKRDVRARMSIRVDPQGFTAPQTLEIRLSKGDAAPQVYAAEFHDKRVLRFDLPLVAGTYKVEMRLAGGPLEVRILGIQVADR